MKILVVDDSKVTGLVLEEALKEFGYQVVSAQSAQEAFEIIGLSFEETGRIGVDLIIMSLTMPDMDGIEATFRLKSLDELRDIPIIIMTARKEDDALRESFDAGAADFIDKNFNKVELHARVRSLLRLKQEMDRRKDIAHQFEMANRKLRLLSSIDGLTGIPNRRTFDRFLENEWARACRTKSSIAVIMMDIDFFKPYNDNYGHQKGDEALKLVGKALEGVVKRPSDIVARYGGEEFVMALGYADSRDAIVMAEKVRDSIELLKIPHKFSSAGQFLTISAGIASIIPDGEVTIATVVKNADEALYQAKKEGRNRVKVFGR
ncbi:MAG: diguanylate cyclase [Nitrospinota bacterium]|nr:diguanylate cyclase [Nitrospinota bacterium]